MHNSKVVGPNNFPPVNGLSSKLKDKQLTKKFLVWL